MSCDVVVIGAGGFGRETLDVMHAAAREDSHKNRVLGVADDQPRPADLGRLAERGVKYLGTTDDVLKEFAPRKFVIGIGNPATRAEIDKKFTVSGWTPHTVIHPHATIGTNSVLGEGSVICGGVQLSTNTVLGRHVHLNPNATVGHDTRLEDFVSVNPGSIISGEVIVGSEALLGAGSVVLQGIRIATKATIGASACVVTEVQQGDTVVGVPARPINEISNHVGM